VLITLTNSLARNGQKSDDAAGGAAWTFRGWIPPVTAAVFISTRHV
jgi:hypothetical protein